MKFFFFFNFSMSSATLVFTSLFKSRRRIGHGAISHMVLLCISLMIKYIEPLFIFFTVFLNIYFSHCFRIYEILFNLKESVSDLY